MSSLTKRQFISPEEAKRIKAVAAKISSKMCICGPLQVSVCNSVKTTHTAISGFNNDRAADIIEDTLIRFLLDEDYGKTT